ncbi:putative selenate ABC transporter substrate-binding protein [filamentous cyanobacterium LEGE 11480]|uniref:Selenate ABC transporter substrate-binding protein n=1 Tax=Romeriopsis navalis LEGE 11480 TaxID=2777977 RepID=A0A928VR48_9CYAN|nr:putative selenate ABC transporter substrate-binding protein [Romeriopsis navalis]MBE9031060.1 putative selenate ABC transporter substrate-binding protein [Romeriopsis navalis LEGE 11480]
MIRQKISLLVAGLLLLSLPACAGGPQGSKTSSSQTQRRPKDKKVLTIGAIPDQNPEKLQRLYSKLADYLSKELDLKVVYQPVTDYTAAVTAFKVGDLDLVWFGGLTGVQARLQVPGSQAIVQRAVDEKFRSVFIANESSGISRFRDFYGLDRLKGKSFTFGSETSTSGRLMPQYYLNKAGVKLKDFKGEQPGFSKNHDATIELVKAGTYEVGALNSKVWDQQIQNGSINTDDVYIIYVTPTYYDYHWVLSPSVKERFGDDTAKKVKKAFLKLNPKDKDQAEILKLFSAKKFISTKNDNYADIEKIGREIGKIK